MGVVRIVAAAVALFIRPHCQDYAVQGVYCPSMDDWPASLHDRLASFAKADPVKGGIPVSVKVRVSSGCFHRQHSPAAYELIDEAVAKHPAEHAHFVEHESGPEILCWIGGGLSLGAGVIELIVAVLKARAYGIERGDRPSEPLEVIVRRSSDGKFVSEKVAIRVHHGDAVNGKELGRLIAEALPVFADKRGNESMSARKAPNARRSAFHSRRLRRGSGKR